MTNCVPWTRIVLAYGEVAWWPRAGRWGMVVSWWQPPVKLRADVPLYPWSFPVSKKLLVFHSPHGTWAIMKKPFPFCAYSSSSPITSSPCAVWLTRSCPSLECSKQFFWLVGVCRTTRRNALHVQLCSVGYLGLLLILIGLGSAVSRIELELFGME